MAASRRSLLAALVNRSELRRWRSRARQVAATPLSALRGQRSQARDLRAELDELIHVADSRLGLPAIGSSAFPVPHGTDWSWRPQAWRGPLAQSGLTALRSGAQLGEELTLFHDCAASEMTLRQLRNRRESDLAPYALRLDVFGFDGSFLSLVVNLPDEALQGLKKSHLIRLDPMVQIEKPLEIFARLNIKHGPNTEQLVRELPLHEADRMVEFDLAYTNINEKRIERAWIDLIFERPQMNEVTLRDLTLSRRPRAEL
ncbi:MAG: hypothetical protein GYB53_12060 [Rhodobacteraceae bacterium]|nr:hypothetical protein [Paracoccaceae bacterium]MBR9823197.1 hypothetical protein [Paracoccaceae bacterium]